MKKQLIRAKEILEALNIDADKFYVITTYVSQIIFQGRDFDNEDTIEILKKNGFVSTDDNSSYTDYTKDDVEFCITKS